MDYFKLQGDRKIENKVHIYETKEDKKFFQCIVRRSDMVEEITEMIKEQNIKVVIGSFDYLTIVDHIFGEFWYVTEEIMEALKVYDSEINFDRITVNGFFESGEELWLHYYRVELKEFDKSSIEHIEGRQIFQWNNGYETYPVVSLRVLESILRRSALGIDFGKIDI